MNGKIKEVAVEGEIEELPLVSSPESPVQNGRPSSMVVKKAHTVIPAHLVAEAISTLHGLDLRWSGPITPSEMQYVEQYVFAKYPQYCNGLVEVSHKIDLDYHLPPILSETSRDSSSSSPSHSISTHHSDLDNTQLAQSRLLDIISKKSSSQGNFISIPEIQGRNRALKQCGLAEEDYLVIFLPSYKEATSMIGESYPFFKGNYFMTIISEEVDCIRGYAANKEAKVIGAPETWLDLRIKGSQMSQYFRRKSKHSPKGLFAYPAVVNGMRSSMHWISEAHRNSWHVVIDVTGLVFGEERLALALHRPDFVLCNLDNTHAHPSVITCLLVRKKSFETIPPSA